MKFKERAFTFNVLAYVIILHLMITLTIVSRIFHHILFQDSVKDLSSFTVLGFYK
jgi:hypothetical protein